MRMPTINDASVVVPYQTSDLGGARGSHASCRVARRD